MIHKDEIRIPGMHNVENFLGVIAVLWGEVPVEAIVKVAKEFGGVEHRIEFVRELDGVKYYNDSIATSPTRVLAGLNSFHQKLIVLAGGYDKKIPFEPMWEQFKRVTKENAAIALFAKGKFLIELAYSNLKMYRYKWVWQKNLATGFLNAKKMPLCAHEDILIFYRKLPTYNP